MLVNNIFHTSQHRFVHLMLKINTVQVNVSLAFKTEEDPWIFFTVSVLNRAYDFDFDAARATGGCCCSIQGDLEILLNVWTFKGKIMNLPPPYLSVFLSVCFPCLTIAFSLPFFSFPPFLVLSLSLFISVLGYDSSLLDLAHLYFLSELK